MATCSAMSRIRSATDPDSIVVAQPLVCVVDLRDSGSQTEICAAFRPKEKVGENPPDNASEIRASSGLYGKDRVEASEGQLQVVVSSQVFRVPTLVGFSFGLAR